MTPEETAHTLLLNYVSLIFERHSYGPEDGAEFLLWDDLQQVKVTLVSAEERGELLDLILMTNSWVSFDLQTHQLELISLDDWQALLERRGH
jgi:hypothetical protein